MKPNVLVVTGFGLNCEKETEAAFSIAGADVTLIHFNDLVEDKTIFQKSQILALIGGFSFGDHLGAGTVFANRLKYNFKNELLDFIKSDKLIIGICNGFQTLTRLGLLPGLNKTYMEKQTIALSWNDNGLFRDDWVNLIAEKKSPCVFTKNIEKIYLPIRHGEGKFTADENVINEIECNNLVALRYSDKDGIPTSHFPENPNGSMNNIAGICDPTGRIFGLMPHPEAYLSPYNHPHWTRLKALNQLPKEGDGLSIFKNAIAYFK